MLSSQVTSMAWPLTCFVSLSSPVLKRKLVTSHDWRVKTAGKKKMWMELLRLVLILFTFSSRFSPSSILKRPVSSLSEMRREDLSGWTRDYWTTRAPFGKTTFGKLVRLARKHRGKSLYARKSRLILNDCLLDYFCPSRRGGPTQSTFIFSHCHQRFWITDQ